MSILGDKYYPYIFGFLFFIFLILLLKLNCFPIIDNTFEESVHYVQSIQNLANIIITITSIFMSFLGVGLTLLHQSGENKNVIMLKKNGKYNLLLSYFKQALFFSILAIVYSIVISLGFYINNIIFIIFLVSIFLVIVLNYRIIHFLFKVLEE